MAVLPADDSLEVRSGEDVARTLVRMFGEVANPFTGVIHVAAVVPAGDRNLVWRVEPGSPSSRHDQFVLNVVRAGVDAVITTGRILRREPFLRLDQHGDADMTRALMEWRRQSGRERRPPQVLVLTSGRNIPLDHPLFSGGNDAAIMTGMSANDALLDAARQRRISVTQVDAPGVRAAVAFLRDAHALPAISVEAGPSTAVQLYESPVLVDQVFLSAYHSVVEPGGVAGEFPGFQALSRDFEAPHVPYRVIGVGGEWSFHRLLRKRPI